MNYEDRQKYDKAVDKMLKEKLQVGVAFGIFVLVVLIGLLGTLLFIAFK